MNMMGKLFFLVLAAMFFVSGCGGLKSAASEGSDYPDVNGLYEVDITTSGNCWCDQQSYSEKAEIGFIQSEDASSFPSESVTLLGRGYLLAGIIDRNGNFSVDVENDPRAVMRYTGRFIKDEEGEVRWHLGSLRTDYAEGQCCNGGSGYVELVFEGEKACDHHAPPEEESPEQG